MLPLLMFNVITETIKDNIKGLMNLPSSQSDSSSSVYFVNFNQDCTFIQRQENTRKIWQTFVFFIVLMIPASHCVQYSCPYYATAFIKDNCAGCTLCQQEYSEGNYFCYNDIQNYFTGDKCSPISFCDIEENQRQCKQFGCQTMIGTFKCLCDSNKYGRLCEYDMISGSSSNDYAVVDDIIFHPIVAFGQKVTFALFISNVGRNIDIRVSTPFEDLSFNSKVCKMDSKYKFCEKWFKDLPNLCINNPKIKKLISCAIVLNFVFPAKNLNQQPPVTNVHGDFSEKRSTMANIQTIKCTIYNQIRGRMTVPVFQYTYKVLNVLIFTKTTDVYFCDPTLYRLRNTGAAMSYSKIFTVDDEIVITSSFALNPNRKCANVDNVLIHWAVWKIDVNHLEFSDRPFREVFKDSSLSFQPFSLKKGIYKVKNNITVWKGSVERYDYDYGYFKVIELPLLPFISGGKRRSVYYKVHFLKLNGEFSRDPNLKLSEQGVNLKFYWKCDKPFEICEEKISDYSITYPGPFEKNETYTFSLTIESVLDKSRRATTSQQIHMSPFEQIPLEILCKKNCGKSRSESNPGNIIYLEAVIAGNYSKMKRNHTLVWFYSILRENIFKSADEIRQKNTPQNVLIIQRNSLSDGETYSFQVKGSNEINAGATFDIKMANKITQFSCTLNLNNLTSSVVFRGWTKFSVVCDKMEFRKIPPIYDFYDKYVDTEDKGRLIASGQSNNASNVILTRGKLVIEITNEYGMTGRTEIIVQLKNSENQTEIVKHELENLKQNGSTADAEFRINKISVILDLIVAGTFTATYNTYIIENMLKIASEDDIASIAVLKLWTDMVNRIAKEYLVVDLTTRSIYYLSKSITKLSSKLLYEIKETINGTKKIELNEKAVHNLTRSMLQICNALHDVSDKEVTKRVANKENSYTLHALFRDTSDFLVSSVSRIMLSLALIILPHQSPIIMKENNIRIWVKEDSPESFSVFENESLPSVNISKTLGKSLSRTLNLIIVLVAEYNQNPYKYNLDIDIQTNAVDLQIRSKKGDKLPVISDIPQPILVSFQHIETRTEVINGSACQPNLNESLNTADLAVEIHELRVPYIGRLAIKFCGLEENQVLRVRVLFNLRPDFEFMTEKNAKIITKSSPTHEVDLRDPHSLNIYDLYFIGIFPGENIPVGNCINYSFELSASHCVTWKAHEWSTKGCRVKKIGTSNSNALHCECEHLSTFAGFSQVPINSVDPFSDYKLFLGLRDNPFVFIFISFILSLYFILLIWALRSDYKQKLKRGAIYLEDNFPKDRYPYLIAVYTGSKLFSGTTSNVAILIEGEDACSRTHLLKSSMTQVLQTGDDNWFLIFTPYYLGPPTMIHLWIDYSGKRPEWYCHKVMIVDLLTDKEYAFFVEAWFSLKGDDFVERFVEVSKPYSDTRLNEAIENLVLGFRETHLWMSVLVSHPRSSVTRAERLSLAFTGLLVTMLVSCMFYQVIDKRKEDYPKFTLSISEFIIGVISLAISCTLINIVVSLFRRRLVLSQYEEYTVEIEEINKKGGKKHKAKKFNKPLEINPLKRFFEDVLKILSKPKKFKPVLLNIETSKNHHRKRVYDICWSLLAWTICISMIITCSYLIILYGLKFGKVKSLEWLTSVALCLLQVVFLVSPFRIISLATVSGLLSTKMYEVVSYRINSEHLNECQFKQLSSNSNLDSELISIRSKRVYVPLSYREMIKKLHKQKRKDAIWLFFDMVLIMSLVILMFIQNGTLWTTKYYWNNNQLRSLMRHGIEEEGIQLYALTNLSLYSLVLEKKVFPLIYQEKWYNGLPITATGEFKLVFSGTSKLIGLPRLRQIRLKPSLCQKPIYENLSNYCNVKLSMDTEDTDLYAEGWVSTGPFAKFVELSPWSYKSESETYDTTLAGYSSKAYDGDGYVAELETTEEKTEDIIIYLHREKWLDRLTCAVFLELTLYNAFSGTFSWVISVTENLHMGLLTNRVSVYTVSDEYNYHIFDIIFFTSLLTFTVRVFFRLNRNGVDNLMYNFWNIGEIMIVFLAIACAILYVLNIHSRLQYFKVYLTGDTREVYFQYFHLLKYLYEFRAVLIFLVVFLVCRFIMSLKLGKTFNAVFITIYAGFPVIFWLFIVVFILVYTHWRFISYFINNYSLSLSKSHFIIVSNVDYKQIVENCSKVTCTVSPFILCCISYGVRLIIIANLTCLYRILKRKYNEKQYLNFFTVFCEKGGEIIMVEDTKRKSKLLKLT